eukprot:85853_1
MGTSMLLSGERRSKDDDSFEAMGTVDELCSVVGVVHAELMSMSASDVQSQNSVQDAGSDKYGNLREWLVDTMSRLFDVGSHVAKPRRKSHDDDSDSDDDDEEAKFTSDGVGGGFDADHIIILEEWIDVKKK